MKRKLPFLFGSMAAMMLSASPVVDQVDFSRKLPANSVVSAKVDNLEKLNLKAKGLERSGRVNSTPEKIMSNPWYEDYYGNMPYYISFGNFNCGLDTQIRSLNNVFILQPAYAPVMYYSLAEDFGYTEHEWTFIDPTTDSVATSTEQYLIHEYPVGEKMLPFLTASVNGEYEATYPSLADDAPYYYGIYGGNFLFDVGESEPVEFGAGNYDPKKGLGLSGLGAGSDADWESSGISVIGIMNLFEKPSSPYLLDGLWLTAYGVEASPEATITMTIYKADPTQNTYSDMQGEVIATSTVGVDNIEYVEGTEFANVHFPIMTVDEDGFETEGSILISDDVLVEISGYNTPEFTSFEPIIQNEDHTSGNNYMYIKAKDLTTNEPFIVTFTNTATSWFVNMSASFPHIHAAASGADHPCCVSEDGEVFYVGIDMPSSSMTRSSGIEVVPSEDWISYLSEMYDANTGVNYFIMQAEPLNEGEAGDKGSIKFLRNGEEIANVPVLRGEQEDTDPTGVQSELAKAITSAFIVDDLQLTYPSDVTKLSIYSAAGVLVKIVDLDKGGSDVVSMPMAKGVYILSFDGKERVVRKVVK